MHRLYLFVASVSQDVRFAQRLSESKITTPVLGWLEDSVEHFHKFRGPKALKDRWSNSCSEPVTNATRSMPFR